MNQKQDIAARKDVEQLLGSFYSTVLKDEVIGTIFTEVARIDLPSHLPKLVDFWESMLLGTGDYRGNPMKVHLDLDRQTPLKEIHFQRWLFLWERAVKSGFAGPVADEALAKAHQIARFMQFKINDKRRKNPMVD